MTRQCLETGKHIYSEKPMALEEHEARELVELAGRHGVRLESDFVSSAPMDWATPLATDQD